MVLPLADASCRPRHIQMLSSTVHVKLSMLCNMSLTLKPQAAAVCYDFATKKSTSKTIIPSRESVSARQQLGNRGAVWFLPPTGRWGYAAREEERRVDGWSLFVGDTQ